MEDLDVIQQSNKSNTIQSNFTQSNSELSNMHTQSNGGGANADSLDVENPNLDEYSPIFAQHGAGDYPIQTNNSLLNPIAPLIQSNQIQQSNALDLLNLSIQHTEQKGSDKGGLLQQLQQLQGRITALKKQRNNLHTQIENHKKRLDTLQALGDNVGWADMKSKIASKTATLKNVVDEQKRLEAQVEILQKEERQVERQRQVKSTPFEIGNDKGGNDE